MKQAIKDKIIYMGLCIDTLERECRAQRATLDALRAMLDDGIVESMDNKEETARTSLVEDLAAIISKGTVRKGYIVFDYSMVSAGLKARGYGISKRTLSGYLHDYGAVTRTYAVPGTSPTKYTSRWAIEGKAYQALLDRAAKEKAKGEEARKKIESMKKDKITLDKEPKIDDN